MKKFGSDSFRKFIARHEGKFPELMYFKHYLEYMKSCSKWFKHDEHLLRLFAACNWRSLGIEAIPRALNEEDFDAENREEMQATEYRDLIPQAVYLFNNYPDSSREEDPLTSIDPAGVWPEYIQHECDIPLNSYCLSSDKEDLATPKPERSLLEFLKRQEGHVDEQSVLDRVMLFKQSRLEASPPTNWVYFQLDYGDDRIMTKDAVKKSLASAGIDDIKDIQIMNARLSEPEPEQKLDDLLMDSRIKEPVEALDQEKIVEFSESTANSSLSRMTQSSLKDEALTDMSTTSSEMEKDTQRINGMFKLIGAEPRKNQSYGFLEFNNFESKLIILKMNYRLFGMEIAGKGLIAIEDADVKKTVKISNLPWSLNPSHFVGFLNTKLQASGVPELTSADFVCPKEYEGTVSDASYLFLQANSFPVAKALVDFLRSETYSGRPMHIGFKRGCSKYIKGALNEFYHSAHSQEQDQIHIAERTWKRQRAIEEAFAKN